MQTYLSKNYSSEQSIELILTPVSSSSSGKKYYDLFNSSGINNLIIGVETEKIQFDEEIDVKSLMLISEEVLARDWNSPEEDEAWANL